jgi:hypothetical protein
VVAFGIQEHLGLVLEPSERLGVKDAIPVALECGAELVLRFGMRPTPGERGTLRRPCQLVLFLRFADNAIAPNQPGLDAGFFGHARMMPRTARPHRQLALCSK